MKHRINRKNVVTLCGENDEKSNRRLFPSAITFYVCLKNLVSLQQQNKYLNI